MKEENKEKNLLGQALSFAWELGYSIAGPLVVLALLGRFLDKKFNSSPFLFLAGVFLSIIISSLIVYLKAVKLIAKASSNIETEDKNIEKKD